MGGSSEVRRIDVADLLDLWHGGDPPTWIGLFVKDEATKDRVASMFVTYGLAVLDAQQAVLQARRDLLSGLRER